MRQELIDKFNDWKNNENKLGTRIVRQANSPFKDGEYIISVSEEFDLKVYNKIKNILVEKKFFTVAQSDSEYNPNGDIYSFEQISSLISIEFYQKYNDALTDLFLKGDDNFTIVE